MEREAQTKPLGVGECHICGSPGVKFSQTKNGWMSSNCTAAEGGCNTQVFYRFEQSMQAAARRYIKKWNRPEDRARILEIAPGRHADAADQAAEASPASVADKLKTWWNETEAEE